MSKAKLWKRHSAAVKHGRTDAVTLDHVDGFMLVSDLRIENIIQKRSFSWMVGQVRTFRLVETTGGYFGYCIYDGENKSGSYYHTEDYCQWLFSTLEEATTSFNKACWNTSQTVRWKEIK